MIVYFVGAYNQDFNAANMADSPAANQVQCKIIDELVKCYGEREVSSLSFTPTRSWPYGPLAVCTKRYKNGLSLGYLNISVFKNIIFSCRMLKHLYKCGVDVVVKYNATFSEAVALRILKLLKKDIFICIIIQDVNYPQPGAKMLLGFLEQCSVKLCRGIDFIVPITESIVKDFGLPIDRVMVFNGGITRQTEEIMKVDSTKQDPPKEDYAVFAGALERYNGIDLLIQKWIEFKIPMRLHVFGKGSLSNLVSSAVITSDTIVYHGFVTEEVISDWQRAASFNICLRFPVDLSARYFFPSKLFNVLAARGAVVTNDFANFPKSLRPLCSIVYDDFQNLDVLLKNRRTPGDCSVYQERLKWLSQHCQWSVVIEQCFRRCMNSIVGIPD